MERLGYRGDGRSSYRNCAAGRNFEPSFITRICAASSERRFLDRKFSDGGLCTAGIFFSIFVAGPIVCSIKRSYNGRTDATVALRSAVKLSCLARREGSPKCDREVDIGLAETAGKGT